MSYLDARNLLTKWTDEYGLSGRITWSGYGDLGDDTLGVTRYLAGSEPQISLHVKLLDYHLWALVTLWHEFAHVAAYYESGCQAQAHGDAWKRWIWKKPILALLDIFAPAPALL